MVIIFMRVSSDYFDTCQFIGLVICKPQKAAKLGHMIDGSKYSRAFLTGVNSRLFLMSRRSSVNSVKGGNLSSWIRTTMVDLAWALADACCRQEALGQAVFLWIRRNTGDCGL